MKRTVEGAMIVLVPFQLNFATPYLITTLYKSPYFAKFYDDMTLKCFGNFAYKGDGPIALDDIRQSNEALYNYYILLHRCNNDLIFALHYNKEHNDKREFHVISWKGESLFRLFVDEKLCDFNVDWKNGKLYGITTDDIVYVYDVGSVVNRVI